MRVVDAAGRVLDRRWSASRHVRRRRVPDDEHAARRHRAGHRHRRATLGVRPVGGKTGTTDDYHDAWFVGFSTQWWSACGWASISPRPSAGASGARVALPIWAEFMKRTRASCRPAQFNGPRASHRGAVQRLVPPAGGRVSDLQRIFQGGRHSADRAVSDSPRHPPSERRARDRACGWRAAGEVVGETRGSSSGQGPGGPGGPRGRLLKKRYQVPDRRTHCRHRRSDARRRRAERPPV